ncbi:hypothetical protein [Humibacillus xanthopallidus]|uniref:Uncharacterized protein n=1 Tax=Humibacillus xanthopallidus TaxID=412689 RepID=A0A543H8C3_9MICO|nr:hypothetical protein [Humibacillus xanthopallidus]TQM54596.1 hypothetical protein FBY41_4634 [Humibacillus xanthopallidus]
MADETLELSYAGPALESHSIDARELGPALIAISDLFVTAHIELGREGPLPAVRVVATSEGSFIVHLLVSTPSNVLGAYLEPVADWLNTSGPMATVTGLGIVTPVIGGLAWMVARVRKGIEKRVTPVAPGEIEIEWPDGTKLRVLGEAAQIVESMDMRRAIKKVGAPLRRRGEIDRMTIRTTDENQPEVAMESADLRALDALPTDDTLLTDTEREVVLRLKKVAFDHERKWQVTDGSSTFWAAMMDLNFALKVADSQESFSANDQLRVSLRERQFTTDSGGIRAEHSIVHVIEHLKSPEQSHLPFDDS